MEGRLNYMVEKFKSFDLEKEEKERDKEEAERAREDEDRYYEDKRSTLKKQRDKEDNARFLFYELQKEEIEKISKDNQDERERQDRRLYDFKLREDRRREDERSFMFKQLQDNREVREHEEVKALGRNKEERRDRMHDRQEEADRNLLRDKDRLGAQANAYLTFIEGQKDMMNAKGKLVDKKNEYQEKLNSERASIPQGDSLMINFLSGIQKEAPTSSHHRHRYHHSYRYHHKYHKSH